MSFKSLTNKWLIVKPNVVLTPTIDNVITGLDPYFEGMTSYVTSGFRDANNQLSVIRQYMVKNGLDKKYPQAMTCKVTDQSVRGIYDWQMAWSHLLNLKVIINPALEAVCLMDYFGPAGNGTNRKGSLIRQTPHGRGTAFNVGGGSNGPADEKARVDKAIKDKLPGLVSCLLERNNNALHCDCKKV